jgi:hypothetical protein
VADRDKRLSNVSYFLGALAHGAEQNLGKGSHSFGFLAGKKFGAEATEGVEQTPDPVRAVTILQAALDKQGIWWEFEPFTGEGDLIRENGDGSRSMRLVFSTCIVRSALFRYGFEQKRMLCFMSHGVFAGAMEKVMPGCSVKLEILHAGPNACLKEMIWRAKP